MILVDTCTFLWALAESTKLSESARRALTDPGNSVFLSSVSAWEIAAKYSAGKLNLPRPPDLLVPEGRELLGYQSLPFTEADGLNRCRLPEIHRDPFDRMLICQAIEHGLAIVTPDPAIRQYPVKTVW